MNSTDPKNPNRKITHNVQSKQISELFTVMMFNDVH